MSSFVFISFATILGRVQSCLLACGGDPGNGRKGGRKIDRRQL